MIEPRRSPLHDRHESAGASFTDFGGWSMPVRYSSELAEHHAVREAAGVFDISHMAELAIEGPGAAAFLDYALAGRLSATVTGQAKYSLLLDPAGGIVDDLVVYRRGEESFLVVANAANRVPVIDALAARLASSASFGDATGFEASIDDVSDDCALIAVQGPRSRSILEAVAAIGDLVSPLSDLGYYRSTEATFDGHDLLIGRTGYTGEDGFELYIAAEHAGELWDAALAAGQSFGAVPAGLASRDTLRLEAGMPLYGHELGLDTLPAQAGLGRVVALGKEGDFVGRQASQLGPSDDAPVLVGLVSEGKRAARAGYSVFADDERVGTVTSGALSPTLGHPIAMAYVHPSRSAPETELDLDIRGTRIPARVVSLPFYKRKARQ